MHRWGGEGREGSARVRGEALQGGLGELVLPEGTPQGSSRGNSEKQGWCRQSAGCGVDVILETPAITRCQHADLGAWETGQGAGTRSADWDGVGTARTRWGGWECSLGVSGSHPVPSGP